MLENRDRTRDAAGVQRAKEQLVSVLTESGWPRMGALLFIALLVSEDGCLTSAELTSSLGISPGGVSGGIRYLAELGLVTRERQPGSRRETYRVRGDMWHDVISRGLRTMSRTEQALRAAREVLGPDTGAGQRVGSMLAFYEFYGEQLSGVIEAWDERRRSLELPD